MSVQGTPTHEVKADSLVLGVMHALSVFFIRTFPIEPLKGFFRRFLIGCLHLSGLVGSFCQVNYTERDHEGLDLDRRSRSEPSRELL